MAKSDRNFLPSVLNNRTLHGVDVVCRRYTCSRAPRCLRMPRRRISSHLDAIFARRFRLERATTSAAVELAANSEALWYITHEPPPKLSLFCDSKQHLEVLKCSYRAAHKTFLEWPLMNGTGDPESVVIRSPSRGYLDRELWLGMCSLPWYQNGPCRPHSDLFLGPDATASLVSLTEGATENCLKNASVETLAGAVKICHPPATASFRVAHNFTCVQTARFGTT